MLISIEFDMYKDFIFYQKSISKIRRKPAKNIVFNRVDILKRS